MSINPVRHETELVTAAEMADRLAMSRRTFARLCRLHPVPKLKLGHRTVRYAPNEVIAFFTAKFTTAGSDLNP